MKIPEKLENLKNIAAVESANEGIEALNTTSFQRYPHSTRAVKKFFFFSY